MARRPRVRPPRNPFPSVRYGPGGAVATFDREEDVPEGWVDHPSKVQDPSEEPNDPSKGTKPAEANDGDAWAKHAPPAELLEDEDDDLPPVAPAPAPKKLKKR